MGRFWEMHTLERYQRPGACPGMGPQGLCIDVAMGFSLKPMLPLENDWINSPKSLLKNYVMVYLNQGILLRHKT